MHLKKTIRIVKLRMAADLFPKPKTETFSSNLLKLWQVTVNISDLGFA